MFKKSDVLFISLACLVVGQAIQADKNPGTGRVVRMISEEHCQLQLAAMASNSRQTPHITYVKRPPSPPLAIASPPTKKLTASATTRP